MIAAVFFIAYAILIFKRVEFRKGQDLTNHGVYLFIGGFITLLAALIVIAVMATNVGNQQNRACADKAMEFIADEVQQMDSLEIKAYINASC